MKRYEKMSKEEINNAYYSCVNRKCYECMANKYCTESITDPLTCIETVYNWLQKEIKTKKVCRFSLLKTAEDVDKALEEIKNYCDKQEDCCFCKYEKRDIDICFGSYLKEEIEVEDK